MRLTAENSSPLDLINHVGDLLDQVKRLESENRTVKEALKVLCDLPEVCHNVAGRRFTKIVAQLDQQDPSAS